MKWAIKQNFTDGSPPWRCKMTGTYLVSLICKVLSTDKKSSTLVNTYEIIKRLLQFPGQFRLYVEKHVIKLHQMERLQNFKLCFFFATAFHFKSCIRNFICETILFQRFWRTLHVFWGDWWNPVSPSKILYERLKNQCWSRERCMAQIRDSVKRTRSTAS